MDEKRDVKRQQTWVEAELEDSFDEELEMEIDDERISRE
ncbi:MAG: polyphosphate kinase 2, partial [Rhodospirillaceae bacterium]|nr:polyphosphate kinase 2 [Rhodospirillaceae bacterium]